MRVEVRKSPPTSQPARGPCGRGTRSTIGWLQAPAKPHDFAAWSWHKLRDAGWIMSLTSRDMDGDGDLDVITCEEPDQLDVVWYENPHRRR